MNNSRGIALFISLTLLFLLSIAAVVILLTAYNYANVTENQMRRTRAIVLAEAGVNYAYWKIRIGEDDAGNPVDFGDGNMHTLEPPISLPSATTWDIEVEVEAEDFPASDDKTIRSTVTYPKASVF